MVESMEKESNDIKQEALKMAWYMRGGLNYNQALQLNATERKTVSDLIKDIFTNYENHFNNFNLYRKIINTEVETFKAQLKNTYYEI